MTKESSSEEISSTDFRQSIIFFKKDYMKAINRQKRVKVRAKKRLKEVEAIIDDAGLTEAKKRKILEEVRELICFAYGLNRKRKEELDYIYPLDFIGPEFEDYHDFIDMKEIKKFYQYYFSEAEINEVISANEAYRLEGLKSWGLKDLEADKKELQEKMNLAHEADQEMWEEFNYWWRDHIRMTLNYEYDRMIKKRKRCLKKSITEILDQYDIPFEKKS